MFLSWLSFQMKLPKLVFDYSFVKYLVHLCLQIYLKNSWNETIILNLFQVSLKLHLFGTCGHFLTNLAHKKRRGYSFWIAQYIVSVFKTCQKTNVPYVICISDRSLKEKSPNWSYNCSSKLSFPFRGGHLWWPFFNNVSIVDWKLVR